MIKMTFKIQLTNHSILKSAFESISMIVDEIALTCDSEAVHLRALDRSHITFVILDLDKTFFDEYQCDEPEQIFLDSGEFTKILKKCKNDDILELQIDDNNLIMTMKGDATRTFKIRLIDIEYDSPTPPKMDIPCRITIRSDLLKDYINDMAMFSDKATFMIDEDYLRIRTDGQMGDAETLYLHGENISQVVRSSFAIPKLQEIFKASKFSKECEIGIGDDMPLTASFKLITNDGELSYLLAPRLETD